jgi:hypothetical protein
MGEPQIVTTVEADSPKLAMVAVLRSAVVSGASKVEVSTAEGLLLWSWHVVILLSQRFMYLRAEEAPPR